MNVFNFAKLGINTSVPGFYNDPKFIKVEKDNPLFLNEYNKFVLNQDYDAEYLLMAKNKIEIITSILYDELKRDGRKGACIDISQVISKILEREKIWCCTFSGSMTIKFSAKTGLTHKYFWTVDNGDFQAAHTWLYAPPFKILDLSISQQHYKGNEPKFLPNFVLAEEAKTTKMEPIDLINPIVVPKGLTMDNALQAVVRQNPDLLEFMNEVKPMRVVTENCSISYFPLRGNASDGELEQIKAMTFSGKLPIQVYEEIIRPKLT